MSEFRTLTEDGYLNDFHRQWNERCMRENERVKSMRFSHEYAKAQSERMKELIRQEEERLRKKRKKS